MRSGVNYLLMVAVFFAAAYWYAKSELDPYLVPPPPPEWATWGEPDVVVHRHRYDEYCAYWQRPRQMRKHCWQEDEG